MATDRKLHELDALATTLSSIIYGASPDGATDGRISLATIKALVAQTIQETKISYEANADTNAFTDAFFTKLTSIQNGATENSTDAFLLARTNHTGTQTAATISDFSNAVAANGTVLANAVHAASAHAPSTATANQSDATLKARENHTGTQTAATISDFSNAVAANGTVLANSAKVSADGSVTTHSDIMAAGSGIIISVAERTKLSDYVGTWETIADITFDATGVYSQDVPIPTGQYGELELKLECEAGGFIYLRVYTNGVLHSAADYEYSIESLLEGNTFTSVTTSGNYIGRLGGDQGAAATYETHKIAQARIWGLENGRNVICEATGADTAADETGGGTISRQLTSGKLTADTNELDKINIASVGGGVIRNGTLVVRGLRK